MSDDMQPRKRQRGNSQGVILFRSDRELLEEYKKGSQAELPDRLQTALVNGLTNKVHARGDKATHLLGIPPELRKRIILERGATRLTAMGPKAPGLLTVCRQIRQETVHTYYTYNRFLLSAMDYDGTANAPSFAVQQKYFAPPAGYTHSSWKLGIVASGNGGVPNWQNLEAWCKAVAEIKTPGFRGKIINTDERLAVAAVFRAVNKLAEKETPWELVQGVLESFRDLLIIQDAAWAK
ncbi:hypothetical protein LTR36_004841 [Oleoguttula mirabilis]|uniref:Uncharacterized protein n=1 Tax=Oleoguttula mirabilis TaxID=1507867 RepID=A0AAV9JFX1_9PEZI|nr:hypothetical protein LTR36_004841 [Oleoguttula mirabilis]